MDFTDRNALPEGLGFALALDVTAMKNFADLSNATKEHLVDYIQDSETGDEAKERIRCIVSRLQQGKSVENIETMNRFS